MPRLVTREHYAGGRPSVLRLGADGVLVLWPGEGRLTRQMNDVGTGLRP